MNELEKENNMLKQTNIEQYEQIQKLQEENEQLRTQLEVCKSEKKFRFSQNTPLSERTQITTQYIR